jgi:hypothetical protein
LSSAYRPVSFSFFSSFASFSLPLLHLFTHTHSLTLSLSHSLTLSHTHAHTLSLPLFTIERPSIHPPCAIHLSTGPSIVRR